jgi:hypothetical protein
VNAILPPRIPKHATLQRWRSPAHTAWIRGFACCVCGSFTNIAAAHVRLGSNAGMGLKPDDWRTVPLCDGPRSNIDRQLGCHNRQHIVGEQTFWSDAGKDPEALIEAFIKASPKRSEIERVRKERASAS